MSLLLYLFFFKILTYSFQEIKSLILFFLTVVKKEILSDFL